MSRLVAGNMSSNALPVTRSDVEDFLYEEADLLDRWRLDEWIALFEDNASYLVPSTDLPSGGPETSLYIIADDRVRLNARVKRLKSRAAHVENPRSRTRHIVSNVRVRPGEDESTIRVNAAFVVYRIRRDITDIYIGSYSHLLAVSPNKELKYRQRMAILDLDSLRPSGHISIII